MTASSSIDMLQRLVAFDTTSRNSNLDLIKFIQGYLTDHDVPSTLVPNEDGTKANLFATFITFLVNSFDLSAMNSPLRRLPPNVQTANGFGCSTKITN